MTWDLAGALVEWELSGDAEARLLAAFAEAGGEAGSPAVLRFYRLAYAAFRAGQTALCAGMTADHSEQERLWRAHARYRDQLRRLLEWDGPFCVGG